MPKNGKWSRYLPIHELTLHHTTRYIHTYNYQKPPTTKLLPYIAFYLKSIHTPYYTRYITKDSSSHSINCVYLISINNLEQTSGEEIVAGIQGSVLTTIQMQQKKTGCNCVSSYLLNVLPAQEIRQLHSAKVLSVLLLLQNNFIHSQSCFSG